MKPDYKGFAIAIVDGFPESRGMNMDGGELQELAYKYGLLKLSMRVVPCGDDCSCAEVVLAGDESECYRINYKTA